MKEIYKDIPVCPGYKVSNHGNVIGPRGKVLKPSYSHNGYLRFSFKRKNLRIHRIVMLTFVGQSDLEVNHINGNKEDNRLINLEYTTKKENIKHAIENGKMKNEDKMLKVGQYKNGVLIKEYLSAGIAAKEFGSQRSCNIQSVCKGRKKSAYGYQWAYL